LKDWDICGCEPGKPEPHLFEAVSAVSALFVRDTGDLWPKLRKEARRLIEEAKRRAQN
jgi:hypothetical protein